MYVLQVNGFFEHSTLFLVIFLAFFRSTFRLRGPEKMGLGQNFQKISKVRIFRHIKPLKNQIKKNSPEKSCSARLSNRGNRGDRN